VALIRITPILEMQMKKITLVVPAAAAVVLLSAMVFAAPQAGAIKDRIASAPDRSEAFQIASAD
jgi:hypothetical protein